MDDDAAMPDIRPATPHDAPTIAGILAEAFADDPVMNWMFGGAGPIKTLFRELTEKIYLKQGFGHIIDNAAATLWLPPGEKVSLPMWSEIQVFASIFKQGGASALKRGRRASQIVLSNHPREPHFYLFAVGVRSAKQGMGLGGAIIRKGLEKTDIAGKPAYLENSKPRNTPLYERLGFDQRQNLPLPDGAPPLLAMLRPARGGGQ